MYCMSQCKPCHARLAVGCRTGGTHRRSCPHPPSRPQRVSARIISAHVLMLAGFVSFHGTAAAEDDLWQALISGKVDFFANYRYEHVEDDLRPRDADAATLRTTLGYTTGAFYDFGLRGLLMDVREAGAGDFDDGSGRPNAHTDRAVVADPSDTDFLEAYLSYTGFPDTVLKLGRQIMTHRDAPFHRFLGTVVWRQTWQNHDGFSVYNTSLPDTTIQYGYSWNVNRIFTDEAPGSLANFDSDSHFLNVVYRGVPWGRVEAYAYLLDFDNAPGNSTQTYGLRFSGAKKISERWQAIYTLEYAHELDYAGNPGRIDAGYFLGEAGAGITLGGAVESVTLKFSYELLGGDGGSDRFITPLATGHAFQGWADRFLDTPQDGIEDYFVTAVIGVLDANLTLEYHDLNSDDLGYHYGEELDLMLTRTFFQHYTLGLKYADYDADRSVANLARNGPGSASPRGTVVNDASRFWAFAQVKF